MERYSCANTMPLHSVLKKMSDEEISRSVLVSSIPQGTKKEALVIHFQTRKHGGGDVSSATPVEQGKAVLTFDDAQTVRTVLEAEHRMGDVLLNVDHCPAGKDINISEVFTQVTAKLSPHENSMKTADILTHLKDKIGIAFEKSNGSFIITGSLAQINECQQILLQHFNLQETIRSGTRNRSFEATARPSGTEIVTESAAKSGSDTRFVLTSEPNEEKTRSTKPEAATHPGASEQRSGINPGIASTYTRTIDTDPLVLRFVKKIYRDRLESIRDRHCVFPDASRDDTKLTLQPMQSCDVAKYNAAWNEVSELLSTASQGMDTWRLDIEDKSEHCLSRLLNHIQTKCPVLIEKIPGTRSLIVYGDVASVKRVKEMMMEEGKSGSNGQVVPNGHGHNGDPSRVQDGTSAEPSTTLYEFHSKNGVTVSLHYGDITEERVDAIVNPANERLSHGVGLARLIAHKGGDDIKRDSERIIRRHNYVPLGGVVYTSSGHLPCKYVIHAVGPEWGKQSEKESRALLKKATFESLSLASHLGLKSVALPAISSGVSGFPLPDCAKAMMTAVEEYLGLSKKDVSKNEGAKKGNQTARHSTKSNEKLKAQKKGVPTPTDDPSEDHSKGGICDIRFVFIDADAMDVFEKEFIKRFSVERKGTDTKVSYV